jgi:hypothetical protein
MCNPHNALTLDWPLDIDIHHQKQSNVLRCPASPQTELSHLPPDQRFIGAVGEACLTKGGLLVISYKSW